MFSAFTNSLKIPELRQKIFFTLALLFIARVGANIPLPGMNIGPINDFMADQSSTSGGLVGLYNMFTGGALLNGAVFALGIMPYISASIIMQLVGAVFPSIARLQVKRCFSSNDDMRFFNPNFFLQIKIEEKTQQK